MTSTGEAPPGDATPGAAPPAYAARPGSSYFVRAERYATRSARRHAEEWRLVRRVLGSRPLPRDVLDVPCGTGRLAAEFLARGARVRCADLSPAMRAQAEASLAGRKGFLGVEARDLEAEVARDAPRHDLVLCFRFLHHLPDAATRRRVLSHLAARCRGAVLVSFHHPVSLHQVARGVRRVVTRRRGDRHAITLRALRTDAGAVGLRVVAAEGLAPGLRDLWVALLEPAGSAAS